MSRSAILFGATGAVGKALLSDLLASPHYDHVHAFVRRPFKADSAKWQAEEKLSEHLIDFEKLLKEDGDEVQKVKQIKAEAVYVTLGTTRAQAGSAKTFQLIDRDYVVASAKAALADTEEAQRIGQRVLYCSSSGASSSSPFLYTKSKGQTEEGLASLGYPDVIIMRPGFLAGAERPDIRLLEQIYTNYLNPIISRVTSNLDIPITELSKAFLWAGMRGSPGLTTAGIGSAPSDHFKRQLTSDHVGSVTIVANAEAKKLAKEQI